MKIRHFGLPPTSLLKRTEGAATTAAPKVDAKAADATEVALEGGALTFPRGAVELGDKVKAERGRVLLETLRADGDGAFGGRVKGGVDVGASLRAYLRSLEVAQISTARGANDAVSAFLEALDVPDDIRPLLTLAVDSHDLPAALGKLKQHENDGNTNAMWQRWQGGDHAVHTVTDDTVRKWFTAWGAGNDLNGYLNVGDASFKLGCFRFFARAKELGINVTANSYAGFIPQLPVNEESARTLHRFARAFNIDPANIQLGNRALSTWSGAGRAARAVPGSPLGREAQWLNRAPEWQQAFARSDVSTLKINDASLRVVANASLLADPHSFVYNAPADMKTGAIQLLARAKELGLEVPGELGVLTNIARYAPGSAENAKALTRLARAAHVDVGALPLGGKPVAEWLGPSKAGASAAAGSASVSKRGPLGKTATWENDSSYNAIYAVAQAQPASTRSVTDATIAKWFGAWGPSKELNAYNTTGNAEARVSFCLWWARGKELGLPGTVNAQGFQSYASAMPNTPDAAGALRRLGAAFGFDAEGMLLAGTTPVSSYPRRAIGGEEARLPPRASLGATRFTPGEIDQAIDTQDAKLFEVDDGTLKKILEKHPGLAGLTALHADRGWQIGVLDLAERAVALGVMTGAEVQELLRTVPYRQLDDDAVCERMATLAVRAGLSPGAVALANGVMLSAHPTTKPHVEKLERVLEGASAALLPRRRAALDEAGGIAAAGPLGNKPGPHSLYWSQQNREMFEISDDAIRAEMMTWGDFSWMSSWNNDPGVITLIARIAELNAETNPNAGAILQTRQWLANPVPEMFGTADALPRVLRAARAAGVDPATVHVLHAGQQVPLLEHPALAPLLRGSAADIAQRETALAEDLAMLASNTGQHPAAREGAALRLLGVTDPDHEIVHTLDELLPAALGALQQGALERVDLRKVPAKHADKLLAAAFARDHHPGFIALFTGIFFRVDAPVIEKLLLDKGHLPAVAKELAQIAAALQERSAKDIAFAAMGASKEPAELSSLAGRLWLLDSPAPAALAKRLRAPAVGEDAHGLAVAMLELAASAATSPARRTALIAVVQKGIDDGELGHDQLLADLPDAVKAGLDATAVQSAKEAVLAFLQATPSQIGAARTALSAALGAASWVDDPNIIAKAALEEALAHDLKFVAPLGQLDVDAGLIVGKPWQTRLAAKAATASVAGLQLPREGDATALALPSADEGTGKKNLQLLATRWLARRPVSIVGADGPDAVRAIVRATGATAVDIVIKPDTSIHDLLGADGPLSKAIAASRVAVLRLEGAQWPAGLGSAMMAAAAKARIVATGPALPGFPAITFSPLDEASVAAHLRALGRNDDDVITAVANAFIDARTIARDGGAGDLDESAFPLALLDRIAARVNGGGGELADGELHRALSDVLALRVGGDARSALLGAIEAHTPRVVAELSAGQSDSTGVAIDGKVAVVGASRFAVVGVPAAASSLPALTSTEVEELRAASVALELGEPVVADPSIAERVGTLYGAITGRDVHVHLLHAGSKAEDVLGNAGKDVVAVLHEFTSAPLEMQQALWSAAAEGRLRIVAADPAGLMSSDGLILRQGPVTEEDQAERLRLRARELGVPDALADGLRELKAELDAMIGRQELHPLTEMSEQDLDTALDLLAQLNGAMSTVDAFVAATSASYPMSTPAEQELLESVAGRIAG